MSSTSDRNSTAEDILSMIDQFGRKITQGKDPNENTKVSAGPEQLTKERASPGSSSCDDVSRQTTTDSSDDTPSADNLSTQYTSVSSSYGAEWHRRFDSKDYLRCLKSRAIEGDLRSCRFRSLCWKIYLEVLPENKDDWLDKTREWREKYNQIKDMFITNPHKAENKDLHVHNPLSQAEQSPWNQFFMDNELRSTIKQDVVRTFPELEFFQSQIIQPMMSNILFCISRDNLIGYKQGMHELLAPLIFVLHCDQMAFLHACELESIESFDSKNRDTVKELMDPNYIEHDAYAMFCQVMDTVEPWYISKECFNTGLDKTNKIIKAQPFAPELQPSNVIVNKLTRIQDYVLKKHDYELYLHLERLDIYPQIYGIRWIRLLFGREFPMQDLLVIWDSIFSDGLTFDLVDHVFVAMLLYVRDLLLGSDYSGVLGALMRFPPVGDIQYLIDKALYLRDPTDRPRPPNYTYNGFRKNQKKKDNNIGSQLAERIRTSTLNSWSNFTKKIAPKSAGDGEKIGQQMTNARITSVNGKEMKKSPSEPMTLLTEKGTSEDNKFKTMELKMSKNNGIVAEPSSPPVSPKDPKGMKKTKHKNKSSAKVSSQEALLQHQVALLQGRQNDSVAMAQYCASKMDIHIDKLQSELLRQDIDNEDEILLSLAGLKQVRDILKGTLKFSVNILDPGEDFTMKDNHYRRFSGENSRKNSANPNNVMPTQIENVVINSIESCHEVMQDQQSCDHEADVTGISSNEVLLDQVDQSVLANIEAHELL